MDAFFASAAEYFQGSGSGFVSVFCTVWRYLAPVLAVLLLWRCARPLLKFRREPETWAWLVMPDGNQLPLTHWENRPREGLRHRRGLPDRFAHARRPHAL